MDKTQARHLKTLATFLRKLPKEKFDYRYIVKPSKDGEQTIPSLANDSCGSSACAIGWAPEALPQLLRYSIIEDDDGSSSIEVCPKIGMPPMEGREEGYGITWSTAMKVFGLTGEEADFLFAPDESGLGSYASAEMVADHIDAFVKAKLAGNVLVDMPFDGGWQMVAP